jgi:simple sugar transport system ATP-binding protein
MADARSGNGTAPIMELIGVSKQFLETAAVRDVSMSVYPSEVTCLLGDNGAGKSTLIKIMSGVHQPTAGGLRVDGHPVVLSSPRAAQALGIGTVHQDDGTLPLMSVSRNFFLGREPVKGWGPARRIDKKRANGITVEQLTALGITRVTNGEQPVGTLSGGERQALAISRALYFGARLLILDEPTSSLGVREAGLVLRLIQQAKARGVAIVFITHNAHHAMTVGDRFTVLIHGKVAEQFGRGEQTREDLINLMAGGRELESLQAALEELDQSSGADNSWTPPTASGIKRMPPADPSSFPLTRSEG